MKRTKSHVIGSIDTSRRGTVTPVKKAKITPEVEANRASVEAAAHLLEESARLVRKHAALYDETGGVVYAIAGFTLRAVRDLARHAEDHPLRRAVPISEVLERAAIVGIKGFVRAATKGPERRVAMYAIIGARAGWVTYLEELTHREMARTADAVT